MAFKSIIGAACTCLLVTSINANAAIINTLSGVDYEWLELTETAGMSRLDVETELMNPSSSLYGYEYASRELVHDLFLSYTPWNGISGRHTESAVVQGREQFLFDFGVLYTNYYPGTQSATDINENLFTYSYYRLSRAFYGFGDECGTGLSCYAYQDLFLDSSVSPVGANLQASQGYEYPYESVGTVSNGLADTGYGSLLIKSTVVPLPAAVWLFGSGLIGLIGIARRKKA